MKKYVLLMHLLLIFTFYSFSQKINFNGKISYIKENILSSGFYEKAVNGESESFFNASSYIYIQKFDFNVEEQTKRLLKNKQNGEILDSFELSKISAQIRKKLDRQTLTSFTKIDYFSHRMVRSRFIADEQFCISDTLNSIDWKIFDDTITIESIKCQKATGLFGGVLFNVWFAPSISFSAGPFNMHGLPGIIILAESANKKFRYRMTSIEMPLKNLTDFFECSGKMISIKEFSEMDSQRKVQLIKSSAEKKKEVQKNN